MKLTINSNQLRDNPATFLRKASYAFIRDHRSGQESYVRRLTGNFYPRLHCYIFEQGGQTTFNLHLDQRATRYEGQKAHAGEYDSQIVQEELERLQNIISNQQAEDNNESFESIAQEKKPPKKSWWPF